MRSTIITSAPGSPGVLRQSIEEDGQLITYAARGVRGILSPTPLDADQNNYAPSGFTSSHVLRLITIDATPRAITGFDISAFPAGERDGVEFWVHNVGFNGAAHGSILFPNNDAGSDEINRILNTNNGTSTLLIQGSARVWWDPIQGRWRCSLFT